MREDDRLALAPVLVEDPGSVLCAEVMHGAFLGYSVKGAS
jgi:hypothetical protein